MGLLLVFPLIAGSFFILSTKNARYALSVF
jgi:hypothetical protein